MTPSPEQFQEASKQLEYGVEHTRKTIFSKPSMKIIEGLPWWFFLVKRKFPTIPLDKVGITWGDCIYTNDPVAFSHPQKLTHEWVHAKQQHHSKLFGLIWWWAYCRTKRFRFEEELEGYRVEWDWVQDNAHDEHQNFRYLNGMATMLASEHYGNLVSVSRAKELIDGDENIYEAALDPSLEDKA